MSVELVDDQDDPLPTGPLLDLAEIVLEREGYPSGTEVAISLIDQVRMTELNTAHMGADGATDVLSFPIEDLEPGVVPDHPGDGPPLAIGDVLICPAVVRSRAEAAGVPFEDEMALMVVHGLLHLMGYDHVDDADAEQMEARERAYLAKVGRTRR